MIKNHLRHLAAAALISVALPFAAQAQDSGAGAAKPTPNDMIETYGWFLAQNTQALDLNADEQKAFMRGVQNALEGKDGPEDPATMAREVQNYLQQRVTEKQAKKSDEFFASLKENPNVKQSPTGLYYEIIEEGGSERAGPEDSVKVHYKGTLVDGTEFDSSYKRGQPATFPVGGVVKGFGEGVQLVGPGGKVKLYIPGDLGYGPNPPRGSAIPPNGTLIFDVEMVEVNP
ncbi:MAG: FKBP-type peptidyl-prolyl cis-trans isomerase [Puniceicoccales bacterium]